MILKGTFPTEKFKSLATPFYFYDITLLKETLNTVKTEAGKYGYHVHYAVKANANPRILSIIAEYGLGADCVSGGDNLFMNLMAIKIENAIIKKSIVV